MARNVLRRAAYVVGTIAHNIPAMADDVIGAIIRRYARFNRSTGKPLQCEAGSTDLTRHSDGKIAYRNTEAAALAAAEIARTEAAGAHHS